MSQSLKRIVFSIGIVILIFVSLMTFPAFIHWMISVWLGIAMVAHVRHKPMWPWLSSCLGLVIVKRPGFTMEFGLLLVVLISVCIWDWRRQRLTKETQHGTGLAVIVILFLGTILVYGGARWFASESGREYDLDDRPIACLGDSLTDYGYPEKLEKLISVPVADFGVSGIKTDDGIKMIPEILAADPQLIVIELGGHDFNAEKKPRAATKANLEKLIETFLDRGIAVILVEIPRGFISDPYDGLERELAARYDLQLIDDSVIRNFVLYSPIMPPGMWLDPSQHYSTDGLHPNDLGNEYFARIVCRALVKVYGRQIRKED